MPEISIVMACHNGERWLAEAIESVLLQTFQDWELIVVDDGSSDSSGEIIAKFASREQRIVPITKPHTGLADSLNWGISRAHGDWVARLDADDLCEPRRLEVQLSAVNGDPDVVFLGSAQIQVDQDGREVGRYQYPKEHHLLLHGMLSSGRFPPHSSALIRLKSFQQCGGYRTRFHRAQDLDLWLRLSEVGKLKAVPDFLVKHRLHKNQLSHSEGGRLRIIYSRAAIISYWLRQKGINEPCSGQEDEFRNFLDWIGQRLTRDNAWEYLDFVSGLKIRMSQAQSNLAWHRLFVWAVSHPGFLVRLVGKRYGKDTWPRRAAQAWASEA